MKDEKAKYLMVDVNEVNKQLYHMERVFAFNDFDNIYTPEGMISAREIFDKYKVPEEFQKIIVKVNTPFFIKQEIEEYTMGFPFAVTRGKIEKEDGKKYINISNYPFFYDNWVFRDKIKFRTELRYFRYDDIIEFLSKVRDSGCLKLYMQSINDFFDNSVDLDYIFSVWEDEKDVKKTLARYKQKYPNGVRYK